MRSLSSPMSARRNWNSADLSCFFGCHAELSTAQRAMPVSTTAASQAADVTWRRHFFEAQPATGFTRRTRSEPAAESASSAPEHRVPTASVVTCVLGSMPSTTDVGLCGDGSRRP